MSGYSERLKQEAIAMGLCGKWEEEWDPKDDVRDLAFRYVDGISFCLLHDWPDLDFIRSIYAKECNDVGLYVDENVDFRLSGGRTLVFRGNCTGKVELGTLGVFFVYLMDNSNLEITGSGLSRVFVKLVGDNAKCVAKKENYSIVKVKKFNKSDIV